VLPGGPALETGPDPSDDCVELVPVQSLATQTGTLPFTGVFVEAAGLTDADPIWTVPTAWSTVWLPLPGEPVFVVEPEPVVDWSAFPPVQSLRTQTGTLPFTGVFVEAAGLTDADPTWTVPTDWSTVWLPLPGEPVFEVEPEPVVDWVALPPVQSLRTQTGTLPFAGALAEAAGLIATLPTWAVPID